MPDEPTLIETGGNPDPQPGRGGAASDPTLIEAGAPNTPDSTLIEGQPPRTPGGISDSNLIPGGRFLDYNLIDDSWSMLPPLPLARTHSAAMPM